MFSSDLVSFPAAVTVKVWPALDRGAVKEIVSLFVPVYPVMETPSGREDVSIVYPLLMFISSTAVDPVNTSALFVSVSADGVNVMLWLSVFLSCAICNS